MRVTRESISITRSARRTFSVFLAKTARVAERLRGMRAMADAGYLIGLTIAPIIAAEGWTLRRFFEDAIARVLPAARILYWT